MNVLIYLGILIICILSIQIANKLLKKLGLTIIYVVMSTVSFLLAFKYTTLSTINLSSNSITYVSMFTSLYLLLENTNKKEVKKIANLNFLTNVFIGIMLFLMTYHTASLIDPNSINMKNVFFENFRILLTYPIVTLLANHLLILMYEKIKKLYEVPFITTVTTFMLVGLIEGIIYNLLVYANVVSLKTIIELILATYMVRLIITVIYSLFLTLEGKRR